MPPSLSAAWRRSLVAAWLTVNLLAGLAMGLRVSSGSPCTSACQDGSGGDTTITTNDVVCEDPDFASRTVRGMKFKECTQCLETSRYTNGEESDTMWFLYNVRYVANVCLYNYPSAVQNKSFACDIPSSCGGLKTALREGDLKPVSTTQLQYCTADNSKMNQWAIKSCTSCLWNAPDSKHLSNFMVALDAGCVQKPASGDLLGLTGSLFSSFAINITDPPKLETGSAPPAETNMDTGTIIGIAIGAALVLVLGVALFVIYWRKQKRAKAEEQQRADAESPDGGSNSVTALYVGGGGGGPAGGRFGQMTTDYKHEITTPQPFGSLDHRGSGSINGGKMSGVYSNSGDYYDQFEKYQQIAATHQYGMLQQNGSAASMPAHPAYIPRATMAAQHQQRSSIDSRGSRNTSGSFPSQHGHSGSSSYTLSAQHMQQQQVTRSSPRGSPRITPEPITLAPVPASKQRYTRTTTTTTTSSDGSAAESYIMQKYLAGNDNRTGLTMPPPPPPPPPQPSAQRPVQAALDPANMPPPPPPAAKIPSLSVPAVPRVRVPKQYLPPRISSEEATPS